MSRARSELTTIVLIMSDRNEKRAAISHYELTQKRTKTKSLHCELTEIQSKLVYSHYKFKEKRTKNNCSHYELTEMRNELFIQIMN